MKTKKTTTPTASQIRKMPQSEVDALVKKANAAAAVTKLVYVEYGTECDDEGAELREHPSEAILERTRDQVLIDASVGCEPSQGIVRAYFGVDGHWHFDSYLTRDERNAMKL